MVLFRNRFFSVDVLSEAGEFLPTTALQQALEHIVASDPTAGPGIGALTAEERTHWGEVKILFVCFSALCDNLD